jgi:hypothetical protein
MGRRISLIVTLFAWLLATGSHWDLVQTFAWARMVVSHSQTVSWREAVILTFDSQEMCNVCRAVDAAKRRQADPAAPEGKVDGKVILVFEPAGGALWFSPGAATWPPSAAVALAVEPRTPPTPPPRGV